MHSEVNLVYKSQYNAPIIKAQFTAMSYSGLSLRMLFILRSGCRAKLYDLKFISIYDVCRHD